MKLYITGSTGSGKTTTARELSRRFSVPFYMLDELVWDNSEGFNGTKYPDEVRDSKIEAMLKNQTWIAEGIYFKDWMLPVLHAADFVFILTPPTLVRDYRLIKRCIGSWFQSNGPKEGLVHIYKNISWGHAYERRKMPEIVDLLDREGIRYYQYSGSNVVKYVADHLIS